VIFAGLSLFRLGSLSGFISRPVLRGFAFGLAVTIILKQAPRLFGVSVAGGPVWRVVMELLAARGAWNLPSLLLGTGAGGAAGPAPLAALAGSADRDSCRADAGGGLRSALGVVLAGPVALAWPSLALPSPDLLPRLAQLAAPIALILYAESWGTMRTWR
jgi:hypothetical protein